MSSLLFSQLALLPFIFFTSVILYLSFPYISSQLFPLVFHPFNFRIIFLSSYLILQLLPIILFASSHFFQLLPNFLQYSSSSSTSCKHLNLLSFFSLNFFLSFYSLVIFPSIFYDHFILLLFSYNHFNLLLLSTFNFFPSDSFIIFSRTLFISFPIFFFFHGSFTCFSTYIHYILILNSETLSHSFSMPGFLGTNSILGKPQAGVRRRRWPSWGRVVIGQVYRL